MCETHELGLLEQLPNKNVNRFGRFRLSWPRESKHTHREPNELGLCRPALAGAKQYQESYRTFLSLLAKPESKQKNNSHRTT